MAERIAEGARIRRLWRMLSSRPGGQWLFSRFVGLMIPYTGSMRANVRELSPGYARVELRERHRVRNHLRSVHAIALANLAEFTTGLATLSGIPDNARGILTRLEIEYLKKARGLITAECHAEVPADNTEQEYLVHVSLRDQSGSEVARALVRWLIGPRGTTTP